METIFFTLFPILSSAIGAWLATRASNEKLKALHTEVSRAFAEQNGKLLGHQDNIAAALARVDVIQGDVNLLNPDGIDQLKMRIENLEAATGLRNIGRMGDGRVLEYRPKLRDKPAVPGE